MRKRKSARAPSHNLAILPLYRAYTNPNCIHVANVGICLRGHGDGAKANPLFDFLQRFSEFFYEEREAELKPGPGSYHSALSWVAPTVIKDFGSEPARPLSNKVCVCACACACACAYVCMCASLGERGDAPPGDYEEIHIHTCIHTYV